MPPLDPAEIAWLMGETEKYIIGKREMYFPQAALFPDTEKLKFQGFFPDAVLNGARLIVLTDTWVTEPEFYPMLRAKGFDNLPPFSGMGAITFIDTIVANGPITYSTLFHELVHVEQYRQLGVSKFSELYVNGFLTGGSYPEIPLEKQAYRLQALFENNQGKQFSVEADVAQEISSGTL